MKHAPAEAVKDHSRGRELPAGPAARWLVADLGPAAGAATHSRLCVSSPELPRPMCPLQAPRGGGGAASGSWASPALRTWTTDGAPASSKSTPMGCPTQTATRRLPQRVSRCLPQRVTQRTRVHQLTAASYQAASGGPVRCGVYLSVGYRAPRAGRRRLEHSSRAALAAHVGSESERGSMQSELLSATPPELAEQDGACRTARRGPAAAT